jgi:tetrathionate reductase subunit A
MSTNRRALLKGTAAAGALATFAVGYAHTAEKLVKGALDDHQSAGQAPRKQLTGNAPDPEFTLDPATGDLALNPDQQVSYAMCLGCTSICGVRVRVDKTSGKILRVAGNPYSPLSADPFLPYDTPVRDSFKAIARAGENGGMTFRSTACGRGNAVLQQQDNPRRVLTPLKRVGPRGSGQYEPISFERLVEEVVEGGDLFGEGRVAGLRAIRDLKTPIVPGKPEFGPRANGLAIMSSVDDGRDGFIQRFLKPGFGSNSYVRHGAYCGGSYRSGSGAMFGDVKGMPHAKPDFSEAEFILFVGTAPGNAGNPFKRQGTLVAKARSEGKLGYVVVDPVLGHAGNAPSGDRARWLPIKPGTDGALAMAMIRWMLEQGRFNETYLAQPGAAAAEAAGEANWTNATHLVIVDPAHPRSGRFLRASDVGLPFQGDPYGDGDDGLVMGAEGPLAAATAGPSPLFHDGLVETVKGPVAVKTSLTLLREQAEAWSLDDYATACGIPVDTIVELAREFTSHGRKAAVNAHGGMMNGGGFFNTYALMMLNTLIGNLNWKGGTLIGGGWFPDTKGPRYDLTTVPNGVTAKGLPLGRNVPYEKTSEFQDKKAQGKPYPADAPWYPNAPGLATEWLSSITSGYPYGVEALVFWSANPVYGIPGAEHLRAKLADPKVVPLIIAIDPFINESSMLADYVVPDTMMYESWGFIKPWNGVPTKCTTARWPVVEAKADRTPDGQPIAMESFLIAVAKALALPGFGPEAIPDADGMLHPLERAEDWYLRGAANVAFVGKAPAMDASDDDIAVSGVSRILPDLQAVLKPEEWRKAATVFAKGGRYEPQSKTYDGERSTATFTKPMMVYNESIGAFRQATSGRRFPGTPTWRPAEFADGTPVHDVYPEADWPVSLVSFKSPLQNSYSIGAPVLRRIVATNPVMVGRDVAEANGLVTGDRVRLTTPGGSLETVVVVRDGVAPGVVAIEHGFGHRAFGAMDLTIGGKTMPRDPAQAAGININELGLMDPTRVHPGVWVDPISGASVRSGLPAKLEKLAAA